VHHRVERQCGCGHSHRFDQGLPIPVGHTDTVQSGQRTTCGWFRTGPATAAAGLRATLIGGSTRRAGAAMADPVGHAIGGYFVTV
jgi:hypothetical protein